MRVHKPRIAIPADTRKVGLHVFHMVGEKYLRAVVDGIKGVPMIFPALAGLITADDVLDQVDGLLLPGSPSNIEPHHYGKRPERADDLHDAARDAFTLPLVRVALERGTPILAICRGLQEMNVALGGSLHQQVQEVPGMHDHREDRDLPVENQYAPVHGVNIVPGGLLSGLTRDSRMMVNSLHGQGVDRLAPGLRVEATADDGLVEAFTMPAAPGFNLAVQWHPEWRMTEDAFSMAMFSAFGHACQARDCRGVTQK